MKNCKTNTHRIARRIVRTACLTTFGLAFTFALAPPAQAQTVVPPAVPPGLEVDPPNQAFLVGHALGTQNYECQPTGPLGRVDWVLFTPEATLFDDQRQQIITHFFSPNPDPKDKDVVRATWQDSRDTSAIWARGVASATVDRTAITWVKLQVVGSQVGPTGGDTLFGATFVQRVNTVGGCHPTPIVRCSPTSDIGPSCRTPPITSSTGTDPHADSASDLAVFLHHW